MPTYLRKDDDFNPNVLKGDWKCLKSKDNYADVLVSIRSFYFLVNHGVLGTFGARDLCWYCWWSTACIDIVDGITEHPPFELEICASIIDNLLLQQATAYLVSFAFGAGF